MVGATGFTALNSMASDAAGTLYTISKNQEIITIDPLSGTGTQEALVDISDFRAIAFSRDNVLFAIHAGTPDAMTAIDNLYTIDTKTGVSTLVGSTGYPGIQGLAFNAAGTLFGWEVGSGDGRGVGLVKIDPNTGAATDVNTDVFGSAFDIQTMQEGSGVNAIPRMLE